MKVSDELVEVQAALLHTLGTRGKKSPRQLKEKSEQLKPTTRSHTYICLSKRATNACGAATAAALSAADTLCVEAQKQENSVPGTTAYIMRDNNDLHDAQR